MKKVALMLAIVFTALNLSAQCEHCAKRADTECCEKAVSTSCCAKDAQADADREWMESGAWSNGWGVKAHPSINASEFAEQYRKNQEVWDAMFSYLASVDLDTLSIGRIDIVPDGRCYLKVSEYEPKEADKVNIEQHHHAIDLQYTTSGNELMGYATDVTVKNPYNEKKDVAHFNSDNVTYHKADASAFFLFFPSDYHQPSVKGEGPVMTSRKIVCKIEYVD